MVRHVIVDLLSKTKIQEFIQYRLINLYDCPLLFIIVVNDFIRFAHEIKCSSFAPSIKGVKNRNKVEFDEVKINLHPLGVWGKQIDFQFVYIIFMT